METNKSIFFQELNNLYLEHKDYECPPENKLQFLGDVIFDFTTYDSEMSEYFAKKMLEVIECICNKKTYFYIEESKENHINFLTMVNMPFLQGKLDWGTSIRGAWLESEHMERMKVLLEWSKTK